MRLCSYCNGRTISAFMMMMMMMTGRYMVRYYLKFVRGSDMGVLADTVIAVTDVCQNSWRINPQRTSALFKFSF